MKEIRLNQNVHLSGGFEEYVIDSERDLDVSLVMDQDAQALFRIRNAKSLRIRAYCSAGVNASVLFWNECDHELVTDESFEVQKDAHLVAAYGECGNAVTRRMVYMALREEGAHGEVLSATLAACRKEYRMNVVNFAPHTTGEMKNFAVVLKGGRLMIDAIGSIVHGARKSKSHQTSRALSFEEGQFSEILPELLIDENDVEASHAMSIGRVDDDQLYYLMSRGLTQAQVTALISAGYLLPVAEVIENEEVKTVLKNELERKLSAL